VPETYSAMVCEAVGAPLVGRRRSWPKLENPTDVVIEVCACGVCRTDLHVVDGDLPRRAKSVVPGHEVVGRVAEVGAGLETLKPGTRVGAAWLGFACGLCPFCRRGEENLCPNAQFHGWTRDGGFSEAMIADGRFLFALPEGPDDAHFAPLLCAGLIGYRALRMAGDAERIGLYGFGAAAHIIAQVAGWQGRRVHAFTRGGDAAAQALALSLGCVSAQGSEQAPPEPLDAAILFAPVGSLVPIALKAVRPGGIVVCAGIYMSEIPSFPYELLWGERTLRSVANLTRRDGEEFLALAPKVGVKTTVEIFPLAEANVALDRLRSGAVSGAAVLAMSASV
jgi:propanol-preferring alcohol dehydrogenase